MSTLSPSEVTVWFWQIPPGWTPPAAVTTSERTRAAAFATPHLRRWYEASVWFRRHVLSTVLAVAPEDVAFEVTAGGKPSVTRAQNPLDWRFNLAHSADVLVLAMVQGSEVGVDVERIRPEVDWRGVAQVAFSEAERQTLDGPLRFYSLWTAKEAYLKACGQGLAAPLLDITVEVAGEEIEVRQSLAGDRREWWGWSLRPAPKIHAAVVAERKDDTSRPLLHWRALEEVGEGQDGT